MFTTISEAYNGRIPEFVSGLLSLSQAEPLYTHRKYHTGDKGFKKLTNGHVLLLTL